MRLQYVKDRWVPWACALLTLGGLAALAVANVGPLVWAACAAFQSVPTLVAWRWRRATLAWRVAAEQSLSSSLSDALVKLNPELLKLPPEKQKASEVMEQVVKEMTEQ